MDAGGKEKEKSADSFNPDSKSEKYCPKCQIPFEALLGQSIGCHIEECVQIDHNILSECTNIHCDSTIPSHYNKFSHFKLAALRCNAKVQVQKNDKICQDKITDSLKRDQISNTRNNNDTLVNEKGNRGKKRKCSANFGLGAKRTRKSLQLSTDVPTIQKCLEIKLNKCNSEATVNDESTNEVSDSYNLTKEEFDKVENNISPKKTKQTKMTSFLKMAETEQKITFETTDKSSVKEARPERKCKPTNFLLLEIDDPPPVTAKWKGRKCPFYKKVPDTSFCVDAFSYGSIPGIKCYFLSHFHSDHYCGLNKSFPHPIYCSKVTANLVTLKIKVRNDLLRIINKDEPVIIDGVEVMALDANHCPGSLMFLFSLPDGRRFLHTGDFRASAEMENYSSLTTGPIDELYLDTTYCDPYYNFPPQKAVLDYVTSLALKKTAQNSSILIVCGSYTIGKEKVFLSIAEALNCKIWAPYAKAKVLGCLENKCINQRLVSNPLEGKLHVLSMAQLNPRALDEHLKKFKGRYNEILALKPTGWEYDSMLNDTNLQRIKPKKCGSVSIYGIPYSEHSSFNEMKRFIQFLRPFRVIPTVNNSSSMRKQMDLLFKQWVK